MMRYVRKAVLAAGFTAAAALGTAMLDGELTGGEVLASVGGGLVAGAAVYRVPNDDRRG